ncbi:MAG: hypothetical protein EXS31_08450 [Pedosphaera sp.]|nr:hypothetical protein [Pedosphaera sp.]
MTPLTDTPNEFRRILDNAEAKVVLIQLRLIDKLLEHGTRPVGVSLSEPWSSRVYSTDHPTHWIVADYFCGFANPADNGFVVDCIPKSRVSLDQFRTVQRQQAAARFPHGIETGESGMLDVPNN